METDLEILYADFCFGKPKMPRGARRSPFTVHRFWRRSALGARRSALGVRRSAFGGGQVCQQSQVPHSEEFKQDALLTHPVSKPSRLLQATAERRAVNGER
jgi:hypothetical protein